MTPDEIVRYAMAEAQKLNREWTNSRQQRQQLVDLKQLANAQAGKVPFDDLRHLQQLLQSVGRSGGGNSFQLRTDVQVVQQQRLEQSLRLVQALWAAELEEGIAMNELWQIQRNQRELDRRGLPTRYSPRCRKHLYRG